MMQKMTDAQRAMVERNLPLVTWYLQNRVAWWRQDEYEDLFQIGAIGLCKAAMTYDESRGVRFGTYACECIAGEVWNYIRPRRKREKQLCAVSLEDEVTCEMEGITLADQIPGREDGRTMEQMLILRETLGRVKGRDWDMLLLAMKGFRQEEIAHRLRTTQPTVCRSLRRSRGMIAAECGR